MKRDVEHFAGMEEFSRPVWSAPRLEIGYVSEQTQGVSGPNYDGDFSPQS